MAWPDVVEVLEGWQMAPPAAELIQALLGFGGGAARETAREVSADEFDRIVNGG